MYHTNIQNPNALSDIVSFFSEIFDFVVKSDLFRSFLFVFIFFSLIVFTIKVFKIMFSKNKEEEKQNLSLEEQYFKERFSDYDNKK